MANSVFGAFNVRSAVREERLESMAFLPGDPRHRRRYDGCGNRLTSTETGNLATTTYNPAQELVTTVENTVGTTTFAYDLNGNLTNVANPDGSLITMLYDKENRLKVHESGSSVATYTYRGDGLKRLELVDGTATTLIWDGADYLGEE
jgi:YD repeat-containing protein